MDADYELTGMYSQRISSALCSFLLTQQQQTENFMKALLHVVETQWLLLTVVIIILISVMSLYPLESLPLVPGSDKTHHFIAYATLVFPAAYAKPKLWPVIVIGLFGYSGLIELLQPYVNRYGEWLDLTANAIGLMVGMVLAFIVKAVFGGRSGDEKLL
ncbi:VanZ family protein [Microbulbifer epialgicus]|uniref:VanZ family protein n=1 Tax=Microbulbifer epialgicus TaxID=393907 RepID=A0ABV4P7B1_9GAMM